MGTRSGDHDAAIDMMIMEMEGIPPGKMSDLLNKKAGLLGITGKYTDRRDVQQAAEAGDARAKLAIEIESYRIKKYIGAYSAAIGGADAIVFTAGVGEMSALIREKSLEGLQFMGIKLDQEKNNLAKTRNAETEISADDSKIKIFVIPTDEERVNIEDVIALLESKYDEHTHFTYRFQSPQYVNSQREQDFQKECEKKPELRKIQVKPRN
jgi:acetate kinase